MSKIMIATGGKAGAGKDHVLNILTQYHAGRTGIIRIGGFGDLVRRELGITNPSQDRDKQQAHGQLRRAQDENYWTKMAVSWANGFRDDVVVGFTGVRFLNEVLVLQNGGFRVGLVHAPQDVRVQRLYQRDGYVWSEEKLHHRTETGLDEIPDILWDFRINNS